MIGRNTGDSDLPVRRAAMQISTIESNLSIRLAAIEGEAFASADVLQVADRLAFSAMVGQSLLVNAAATLAGGDPFLADELKTFTEIAKITKAGVIVRAVDSIERINRRMS